jgi:hypothetical protein
LLGFFFKEFRSSDITLSSRSSGVQKFRSSDNTLFSRSSGVIGFQAMAQKNDNLGKPPFGLNLLQKNK